MSYVVIGGGVSGLATAHYLTKLPKAKKIIVLESANRLGGWVQTTVNENGTRHEHGPRTVRPSGLAGENTLRLVTELGLQDEIVPILKTHPSALNRLVLVNGELHKLPSTFSSLFKIQKPFTKPLALAAWHDLTTKAKKCDDDSIYNFVARRLGPEMAKYAIDPMVRGICAGNSRNISAASFVTGSLFQMEQEHGSIFKGMMKSYLNWNNFSSKNTSERNELIERSKAERWSIWSLKNGMESFVDYLAKNLENSGVTIVKNVKINHILSDQEKGGVTLVSNQCDDTHADHVFFASPAYATAELMAQNNFQAVAQLLHEIPFVSVAVITMEFDRKVIDIEAFGFLVPSDEPVSILGTIFDTCSFPQGDKSVFTTMMGGHWFETIFGSGDVDLRAVEEMAVKEVKRILKINANPTKCIVKIQRNCIAQYTIGHKKRVSKARESIAHHPFSLVGTSYDGVGLNDGIVSAKTAVSAIS